MKNLQKQFGALTIIAALTLSNVTYSMERARSVSQELEAAISQFYKSSHGSSRDINAIVQLKKEITRLNPSKEDLLQILKENLDERQYKLALDQIELLKSNTGSMSQDEAILVSQGIANSLDRGLNFRGNFDSGRRKVGQALFIVAVIGLIVAASIQADRESKKTSKELYEEDLLAAQSDKDLLENELDRVQSLIDGGATEEEIDRFTDPSTGEIYVVYRDLALYKADLIDGISYTDSDIDYIELQLDRLNSDLAKANPAGTIALSSLGAGVIGGLLWGM